MALTDADEATAKNEEENKQNRSSRSASTPPLSAMAFTIAFDDDSSKQLNIRDSIRKFAPPKPDSIEKQRPPKINKPPLEASPSKSNAKGKTANKISPKAADGHLSDSASYLIQRMFSSEHVPVGKYGCDQNHKKNSVSKVSPESTPRKVDDGKKNRHSPPGGEKDSGVCEDDKSECGTYTVEAEATDPAVDEARKRIDEVFGVSPLQPFETRSPSQSLADYFRDNGLWESSNQSPTSIPNSKPKRKLPPVPPQAYSDTETTNSLLLKLQTNPLYRSLLINKIGSSAPVWGRGEESRTEVGTNAEKKTPTNNTGAKTAITAAASCADETSSVKSDAVSSTSNEGSDKSKRGRNDTDISSSPPMRFNRAFALRRARLGIDPPEATSKKTNDLNMDSQVKPPSNQSSRSPSFSRNDVGRFSLRTPKNANDSKKPPIAVSSRYSSSREDIRKSLHQRKLSDPNCAKSGLRSNRSSLSDAENHDSRSSTPLRSSSVQRSCSFGESDNLTSNQPRSDSEYLRSMSPFYVSKRMFSIKPHQMAKLDNSVRAKQLSPGSSSVTESASSRTTERNHVASEPRSKKELSALDNLVLSAIHQLSYKLRHSLGSMLEKGRLKYPAGSEARIMIEELLPQFNLGDSRVGECSENTTSRDLSNILKNLKKIEQSIEIISFLLEPSTYSNTNHAQKSSSSSEAPKNYFAVDL